MREKLRDKLGEFLYGFFAPGFVCNPPYASEAMYRAEGECMCFPALGFV